MASSCMNKSRWFTGVNCYSGQSVAKMWPRGRRRNQQRPKGHPSRRVGVRVTGTGETWCHAQPGLVVLPLRLREASRAGVAPRRTPPPVLDPGDLCVGANISSIFWLTPASRRDNSE